MIHTPVLKMAFLLVALWMLFSAGLYFAERGAEGTTITSHGRALYWDIAAFSTAGIADMPVNGILEVIGGLWIIVGSMMFFVAIVATVTAYFMRPLLRSGIANWGFVAKDASALTEIKRLNAKL